MNKKKTRFFTMLLFISVLFCSTLCFVGCKQNVDNEPKKPKLLTIYSQFEDAFFDVTCYGIIEDGKYVLEDQYIDELNDSFIRAQIKYYLPKSVIAYGEQMVETYKNCAVYLYNTKMEFVDADGIVIKSFEISEELTIKNYNIYFGGFRKGAEKEPFIPCSFSTNAGLIRITFREVRSTPTETQPVIRESYSILFKR